MKIQYYQQNFLFPSFQEDQANYDSDDIFTFDKRSIKDRWLDIAKMYYHDKKGPIASDRYITNYNFMVVCKH